MSTTNARFIRLDEAHECLPHVFPSKTSARYCRFRQVQLGMSEVFVKHLGKVMIDTDAAQRYFEHSASAA